MLEMLILSCFILLPFAVAGLFAYVVCSIAFKSIDKKERKQQREAHQAQAEVDMYEMNKLYYEILFNEITKGC